MATRSRIGLRLAGDAILSVYHHWDGYPQWLGVSTDHPHYLCANALKYDYSFGEPVAVEAFFT